MKEHVEGPAGQLDLFQTYIVAAAYLAEACKLFWKNQGCIGELAQKGKVEKDKIQRLISIADPKTGLDFLKTIRDKEAFHWDCAAFEGWASKQKDKVVWVKSSGDSAR